MALRRLVVEDFELIARAELPFGDRLTAITGETGSGKTMLLGAIEFVLGARANADAIRKGCKRARVALEVDASASLRAVLDEGGIETDDDDEAVVIVRDLTDGKTSARVNGIPVTAGQLRAFAPAIAEIVGQHEAQRLLAPAQQLDALDRFGGPELLAIRDRTGAAHRRHAALARELAELEDGEGRALAEADYAAFAVRELTEASLAPGEDETLRARRELLANAERIAAALRTAHDALAGSDNDATDRLGDAAGALAAIAKFEPELAELADTAASLQGEISDLAAHLARRLESSDAAPAELDTVAARLELVDRLKKKYGGTIESAIAACFTFEDTIHRIATSGERRERLVRERDAARAERDAIAAELSAARHVAAAACEKGVSAELAALAMGAARFEIAFEPAEPGPLGAERCEFHLSANPGEPARALGRSASGGELSRVMLALAVVLTDRDARVPLVFDEIDAGIGGGTANAVGARLADLARGGQVVCVTHLAQIAAYADDQFALRKRDDGLVTTIELATLDPAGRLEEIARMLSGATTGVSLQHARTLLRERHTAAS